MAENGAASNECQAEKDPAAKFLSLGKGRLFELSKRLNDPNERICTAKLIASCCGGEVKNVGKGNIAWCSDWNAYLHSKAIPVLYVEAHHDVVCHHPIAPILIGDAIVASWHDNRMSCAVLCEAIASGAFGANADSILYCLFSNREESGMLHIENWYRRRRIEHEIETFIVLDGTEASCVGSVSDVGNGSYFFEGDPIEMHASMKEAITQPCKTRDAFPGNLQYTHAGILHHIGCEVSRMGFPIIGIGPNDGTHHGVHSAITAVSVNDIESLYLRLQKAVHCIREGWRTRSHQNK
jgi:hypothetical protein